MDRTLRRLARLLHQIAHDAGCVLLTGDAPDAARFCTAQYNRIHARLADLAPDLTTAIGPLPADAPAGEVRILARALAGFIDEKLRQRAANERADRNGLYVLRACCRPLFDLI